MSVRFGISIALLLLAPAKASPVGIALSSDSSRIFVAMERPPAVMAVDPATGAVVANWPMPVIPRGLAITADGSRLFVPAGLAPGRLLTLDSSNGRIIDSAACGHSPRFATVSADGGTVFVCNQFENRVDIFRTGTKSLAGSLPAIREPVASLLSPDGHTLFVANLLPSGPANSGDIAAGLSVIDTASGKSVPLRLPNGATAVRALAASPDGRFVYLVHTLAHYNLPTTQLDRGWMNTSALSVIDAVGHRLIATVLLDDIDLGAADPAGVACSPDGRVLAIAHAGTHELSLIDRAALHARIDRASRGEPVTAATRSTQDITNDLSFLHGIRRRLKLSGNGPRTVLATRDGFVIGCYVSRSLHLVTVGPDLTAKIRDIPLAPAQDEDIARRGERLFYDATRCFQHWQSCATCHPGVRTDALNWDLLNDGIGNPKQTKSLLYCMQTPPMMISGVRPNAETAIRSGMRYILFATPNEEDAHAIEAFLRNLSQIPSPALADGQLSPAAKRGEGIFIRAGCVKCHSGPYLTDGHFHNVNTGIGNETGKAWITPTLREIWRTAPYLYDGRAATLEDVIGVYNPGDKHGNTSSLDPAQRRDLIEYLRSL